MGKMLVLLVAALCTAALPAEEYATLSGTVTDPVGDPLAGVTVQVYISEAPEEGGGRGVQYQAVSDDSGRFVIEGVEPGIYDVICVGPGRELSFKLDVELFPGVEVNLAFRADPDTWKGVSYLYTREEIHLPDDQATLSGLVCDVNGMPIAYATIRVEGTDVHATSDEDGYFQTLVPPGEYNVTCSAPGFLDFTYEEVPFLADMRRNVNFALKRSEGVLNIIVRKPNIYFYPPEATEVTVRLELGEGCALTYSDPRYGEGWTVNVEPDGWMDNGIGYVVVPAGELGEEEVIFDAPRYGYLFYEARAPDVWQRERGWLVTRDVMGDFFTSVLEEYGFRGREVDDFLEYWTPRLTESLFYAVYPQTDEINAVVGLRVEPEPDSVLRLFFLIEPLDEATATADGYLPEPEIPEFTREGFTVVEWGVCLADTLK